MTDTKLPYTGKFLFSQEYDRYRAKCHNFLAILACIGTTYSSPLCPLHSLQTLHPRPLHRSTEANPFLFKL